MVRHVGTLLLGAGFYSIGYAVSHTDCLIVEETEGLGGDYTGVFRSPKTVAHASNEPAGREFRSFLLAHGVVSLRGAVDIPALATVVCAYAQKEKIPILLDAALVCAHGKRDGFMATVHTNDGLYEITADRLIDTTALRISQRGNTEIRRKYLHLLCFRPPKDFMERLRRVCPGCSASEGFFPDEWMIHFQFGTDVTLPRARQMVFDWWQGAFPTGEALIDAAGFDFDVEAAAGSQPDFCDWVPPHRFGNPLDAFEAGCCSALGKEAV